DGIAIGFCTRQIEPQGFVSGLHVVAEQIRGAVVGGEKDVQVAVAIEVAEGKTATDARSGEVFTVCRNDVLKFSVAEIQKKVGRLCIAAVAADVAHGVVDVAIGDDEVEPAVEIEVGEAAAES